MAEEGSFNLLEKKWIPVVYCDGHFEHVGIKQALEEAGQIREIADASPAIRLALFRLLVTAKRMGKSGVNLTMPSFLLASQDEFEMRLSGKDKSLKADHWKAGNYLFPETPSDSNIAHFRHSYDWSFRVCESCAARGVFSIMIFPAKGKTGQTFSINAFKTQPLYAIPKRKNLAEALESNFREGEKDIVTLDAGFLWRSKYILTEFEDLDCTSQEKRCDVCGELKSRFLRKVAHIKGDPTQRTGWTDPMVVRNGEEMLFAPEIKNSDHYGRFAEMWRIIANLGKFSTDEIICIHTDGQAKTYVLQSFQGRTEAFESAPGILTSVYGEFLEGILDLEFLAIHGYPRKKRDKEMHRPIEHHSRVMAAGWDFERRQAKGDSSIVRNPGKEFLKSTGPRFNAARPLESAESRDRYKRYLGRRLRNAIGTPEGSAT